MPDEQDAANDAELADAIAAYMAAAREAWPDGPLKRADVQARFMADLIRLRPLRDRVVELRRRRTFKMFTGREYPPR